MTDKRERSGWIEKTLLLLLVGPADAGDGGGGAAGEIPLPTGQMPPVNVIGAKLVYAALVTPGNARTRASTRE